MPPHVSGFTHKSLLPVVATLLGTPYSKAQMSYDLWRLRTNGLIRRLQGTHTYVHTPDGRSVALFYTKTYARLIDPLFAAAGQCFNGTHPQLRTALRTIDTQSIYSCRRCV